MDKTILETVTNLKQSGLGAEEIKSMLIDIGFDEETIKEALNSEDEKPKDTNVKEENKESEENVKKAKEHAENAKIASSLAMNVAEASKSKMDESISKLDDFNDKLDSFENTLSKMPEKKHIDEIKDLHTDLHTKHDNNAQTLDSLEAKINALTKIMKDILENQREILMKLK